MKFDGIGPAAREVRAWLRASAKTLPAEVKAAVGEFSAAGSSDVGLVATFAEAVFEHRESASAEAREIAAACARLGARNGYHGLGVGRRGYRLAAALEGDESKASSAQSESPGSDA